jgi:ATP-dependent Clp protease ATP-binding subunit ClpA
VFRGLTKKDIFRIIDLQVDELRRRLQKYGVSLQLTGGAKQYLLEHGYDAKNGVRPLRRLIQDTIEDQMAVDLLEEKYLKGDIVHVSVKQDALTYLTATE